MEFVEGETLEDKIARGPLPIQRCSGHRPTGCEGLAAAHDKGIIHRDIKPANVHVTGDGRAAIMDFGLARLSEASRLTKKDTAMGTVAYMSPEQAQGMEVDSRTDIWSSGCVLYEMVCGLRPFKGEYDQALFYEIVQQEPEPLTSVRAGVPMELEFIVGKCLAKDREDRTGAAHELARELRTLSDKLKSGRSTIMHPSQLTGSLAAASGRTVNPVEALPPGAIIVQRRGHRLLIAAATASLAGLLVLGFAHFRESAPSAPPLELSAPLPDNVRASNIALSPDGRFLVTAAAPLGTGSLWVRSLDSNDWRELEGTHGASFPFWSPDSRQLGFFSQRRLKKIAAAGGPPQTIAEAQDGRGGSWGANGVIIFAPGPFGHIQKVSESGGEVSPVTHDESEQEQTPSRRFPLLLPDGNHFLYEVGTGANERHLPRILGRRTGAAAALR